MSAFVLLSGSGSESAKSNEGHTVILLKEMLEDNEFLGFFLLRYIFTMYRYGTQYHKGTKIICRVYNSSHRDNDI